MNIIDNIENIEVGKTYDIWSPTARRLGSYLVTKIIGTAFECDCLDWEWNEESDDDPIYYKTGHTTGYNMSDGILLYPISVRLDLKKEQNGD